ncbi:MAG: presqualene diphosphate synthase HpnD [Ignavibacteria bacterium]|nr:MAG: presqualene diphosphate synthase HpnD [Ignavibacteria bacterium]
MGSDIVLMPLRGLSGVRSSFHYSFAFLPRSQRDALKAVYAFCRMTDDIADSPEVGELNRRVELLRKWREELESAFHGRSNYAVLNHLSAIAKRFNIPVMHFYDLLRGVEMDLTKNRYATFEELREYCTLVAASVGLMTLEIFGPRNARTREYAVNLGIALQLTNILRDVGIDGSYGRIYLPAEDLRRFGYPESDLLARKYTPQFRELMEFETARAEEYFQRARALLPAEDRRAMFAPKIMERIYFHTLLRIKQADYNVLDHEVSLPRFLQFLIALKYWVKQRLLGR